MGMESVGVFLIAMIVGVGIGILSGLLGVGGGTILIPTFRLGFGLSAAVSTATSLFVIVPTSLSGLIQHAREKTCLPKLGIVMGVAGALTSPLGVTLADISPDWLVMLAAALIIAYSAFNMLRKTIGVDKNGNKAGKGGKNKKAASAATDAVAEAAAAQEASAQAQQAPGAEAMQTAGAGATAAQAQAASARAPKKAKIAAYLPPRPQFTKKQYGFGAIIGLVAGVASGYVGVGGGFIMVPMMLGMLNLPMVYASGTSLIGITILAIPGVITQILLGHVDFVAGIAVSIGTIPGALIGSHLVTRVPERTLRLLFSCMLMLAAIALVVNELGFVG